MLLGEAIGASCSICSGKKHRVRVLAARVQSGDYPAKHLAQFSLPREQAHRDRKFPLRTLPAGPRLA